MYHVKLPRSGTAVILSTPYWDCAKVCAEALVPRHGDLHIYEDDTHIQTAGFRPHTTPVVTITDIRYI